MKGGGVEVTKSRDLQWGLPRGKGMRLFRRQQPKGANSVPAPIAPTGTHIPPEILAEIFNCLRLTDEASRSLGTGLHWSCYDRHFTSTLGDLRSAILVCRSWYASGVEFLYRNPRIASTCSVRSLKGAVATNPSLGAFVQSIVVKELFHHHDPPRPRRFFHRGSRSPVIGLSQIMKACPNLHSISIGYASNAPRTSPAPYRLLSGLPHLSGLKRLCLSGSYTLDVHHSSLIPYGSLPNLEELYIERTIIDWKAPYPSLPSLRTFHLSSSRCNRHASMFPSNSTNLQNVILENTFSYYRGRNHIEQLYQFTHTLTSLAILQSCAVIIRTIFDPSKFEKLQHLTLDLRAFIRSRLSNLLDYAIVPNLQFDQLPPGLVTLTIMVPFYEDFSGATSAYAEDLQRSICQLLTQAFRSGSIPSLKSIYIEGSTAIWGSTEEEFAILLESKGIKATFVLADATASREDLFELLLLRRSHLRSQDFGGRLIPFGQPWQPS
ncbi:hypothetical protein JAAARDRAFT_33447 [Jaapia argillacea MUCL 33604]|uniref:Uncharacterized protein n=1 Tax=Jaapia argillacea MUCL 33604 TaxID=933084 RepID=A0A067Q175_9AGAM|nr:hypothetical protein JAAARDRAFT_33447 [Jaapia argillacea MUCL 33604]